MTSRPTDHGPVAAEQRVAEAAEAPVKFEAAPPPKAPATGRFVARDWEDVIVHMDDELEGDRLVLGRE